MKSIYFRSEKELIFFCEIIFQKYDEIRVQWKRNKYWGNELQLTEEINTEQIISCFVEVFIRERLDSMIKQIAQHTYYFTDDAEIDHICQLTKSVVNEGIFAELLFKEYQNLPFFIASLFRENIKDNEMIHFDALITFCMKPLTSCLQEAVGYGIDELKREEEHQSFVESIRTFLNARQPKIDCLYIVQDEDFTFYKSNGEKYSQMELRTIMQNEPLYILGLDEEEFNLSPVISLLPKNIYIFGNHATETKTVTLMNLFQERVQFLPLEQFPFTGIK